MPYIKQEDRKKFINLEDIGKKCQNAGELNYVLSKIILGFLGSNPRYQNFNDVLGVLTAIIQELYRRFVAPYENIKIKDNGDIMET